MKVVFISGKYRGNINRNINHARLAAIKLWQNGYVALCPHLNTAHFDGLCPDETWLKGDIELLKRCDSIFMLSNWQDSEGAKVEYELAKEMGIEIMFESSEVT